MIRNVTIATVNAEDNVISEGALVFDQEKIIWLGSENECPYLQKNMDEVIDGKENLLIPGLINAHTHTVYYLMRGLGMDRSLKNWLSDNIWPYLAAVNEFNKQVFKLKQRSVPL